MVPKNNFGSTILVILLGLAGIVGYVQVISPLLGAQGKKSFEPKVYIAPKLLKRAIKKSETPTTAKLHNPFTPMQSDSIKHDSRIPKISQSQVPNASTLPILRGIMEQSGRKFAIIEYNNRSHICEIGNNVSSYTLTGLTAFSAFLEQNGQIIEIKLGNKQ